MSTPYNGSIIKANTKSCVGGGHTYRESAKATFGPMSLEIDVNWSLAIAPNAPFRVSATQEIEYNVNSRTRPIVP